MQFQEQINCNEIELNNYEPLPEAWYEVQVESQEEKKTQRGGTQLSYKLRVIGEKFNGRVIFTAFNIYCPGSPDAESIARRQIAQMGKACRIVDIRDSADLLMKTCKVKVTQDEYEGKIRNKVVAYDFAETSSTVASPSTEKQWFER